MDLKIRLGATREPGLETNAKKVRSPDQAPARHDSVSLRVCLLDPDPQQLEVMSRALIARGYEVMALAQVIGASNHIRHFRPDVLVVEVNMPSISGVKLLQVLRRNIVTMPALVLYSDMDEDELAEIARVAAPDDFVVKKDGLDALTASVRRLGERMKRDRQITIT